MSAVGDGVGARLEAVHSAVGNVASEVFEGVKDLTTDAQVLALKVEEQFLTLDANLHGLTSRVVSALEAPNGAVGAAEASEAAIATATAAEAAAEPMPQLSGEAATWDAEVEAALREDA